MIDVMQLEPPPVGAGFLRTPQDHTDVPVFRGVSYCQAVYRAGRGEALRVLPESIEVCQWAPVVLGLKAPEGGFEEHLAPRLTYPTAGVLLAPLEKFPGEPEVVLLRTTRPVLDSLIRVTGRDQLWQAHGGRVEWSVAGLFSGGRTTLRHRAVRRVNAVLAYLARSETWQAMTQRLFRSHRVTEAYDAIISRTLADMSICRNSTVIPLQSGQVNVSFFCSGGITWGMNHPDHLTSGWPWAVLQRLRHPTQ